MFRALNPRRAATQSAWPLLTLLGSFGLLISACDKGSNGQSTQEQSTVAHVTWPSLSTTPPQGGGTTPPQGVTTAERPSLPADTDGCAGIPFWPKVSEEDGERIMKTYFQPFTEQSLQLPDGKWAGILSKSRQQTQCAGIRVLLSPVTHSKTGEKVFEWCAGFKSNPDPKLFFCEVNPLTKASNEASCPEKEHPALACAPFAEIDYKVQEDKEDCFGLRFAGDRAEESTRMSKAYAEAVSQPATQFEWIEDLREKCEWDKGDNGSHLSFGPLEVKSGTNVRCVGWTTQPDQAVMDKLKWRCWHFARGSYKFSEACGERWTCRQGS